MSRKYKVGDTILLDYTFSFAGKYAHIGRIIEIFHSQYIIQIYYSGGDGSEYCEHDCDCEICGFISNTAIDIADIDEHSEFANEDAIDIFDKKILGYKMSKIIET